MGGPVQGVLFDAGDTLVRPKGGRWFPGHRFEATVQARLPGPSLGRLEEALELGMAHLSEHALVQTVEEERALFQRYYAILLHSLGVEECDDALTLQLAKGMVDGVNFEPFPDTLEVVSLLRESGVRMVVVSNTWPSLDWKLRALGLREFFEALVISTQCGFEKPDPRIFLEASRRMAIAPEHLLFVDDYAPHVAAAMELGFRGLVIRRDGRVLQEGIRSVRSLEDVAAYVLEAN
jgi:HAD superfamily hydrolase (TIGR01509 family)